MKYISLEELATTYGVSISTARRTYRTLRDSENKEFNGVAIIKKEPLPTGKQKVFLLKEYLDSQLSKPTSHSTVQSTGQDEQLSGKALSLLEDQLKQKDQQIREYQEDFKRFQALEEKIIDHVESLRAELREQSLQLEQKNQEIRQLQAAAQHRQNLLDQYTQKQKIKDEKPPQYANYDQVEEVDVEEDQSTSDSSGENESKDFMSWLNSMR